MTFTRIVLPIATFVVFVGIALTAALLPFIPEWSVFQSMTCYLSLAGAFGTGIWMVIGIWNHTQTRLSQGFRTILSLSVGFVGAAVFLFSTFLCLMGLHGFLFEPRYVKQAEFAAFDTTIYVYDSSFLDPEASFTVRRGWLPFMEEIGNFGGVSASDIELTQDGEWAVCDVFRYHLTTGEFERQM